MNNEWTDFQKYKYLYNQTGMMLLYDLNVLQHTTNAKFHEKYSINIFASISRNWEICGSFVAIYDYLTDPTYDAARLKFGLKCRNFAISKEKFEENPHDLKQAGVEKYEISSLEDKKLKEIDQSIGYLENFGENYTDEILNKLANDLEGSNFNEKVINFIEKIKSIKIIGRPTDTDYIEIIKWILSKSADIEFAKIVKVASYAYENTIDLPRKIVFRVDEDGYKTYYDFDYKTKEYKEIRKLDLKNVEMGLSI